MSACLSNDSNNISKISIFINECNRIGVQVLPPHVNKSGLAFTPIPENNQILFGFLAIKGLGSSTVADILEHRPYTGFEDFLSKVPDRTAVISLIKAGAIPTKSKSKLLLKYADMLFENKPYKPVSTYGTKAEMLHKWNINVDDYLVGKKVDKKRVLEIYNDAKKKLYDATQSERYEKHITEFKEKYMQDEFMWEFQCLSMFITHDPLKEAWEYIKPWEDAEPDHDTTIVCVIVDIKNKKDKHGNLFAYLDLYTPFGMIEATCWSRQRREFSHLIVKGNCLAMRGRKSEGSHFFVGSIKPYQEWVEDRKIKTKGGHKKSQI